MIYFVLAAFIALALSKPCCVPDQFEGEAFGYDAIKKGTFFETLSYDYYNRRLRVDVFTHFAAGEYNFTTWEETDLRGTNWIYHYEDGNCTAKKLDTQMKRACVRENHNREYEFTIGGSLNAVFYGYEDDQFQTDTVVARDTCLPIQGILLEHHQRHYQFDARVDYWNVRIGIGNPIVFELPAVCKNAKAAFVEGVF